MCQHINSNEWNENIRPLDTSLTWYLVTIIRSQRKQHVEQYELDEVYDYLRVNLNSLKVKIFCYEIDSTYNQLHSHAVVSVNQYFKFLKYNKFKGFFIKWDVIRQLETFPKINKYLHKDAYNRYEQEFILIRNSYQNINGFQQNFK